MPTRTTLHHTIRALLLIAVCGNAWAGASNRPNFLLIITDDQSWAHTGYAGYAVQTPAFDRLAAEGMYFRNAYASAPTCTASRSAILAGQHFWRLGSAAQLWGRYPSDVANYQQLLQSAGYLTGFTGKGWGPGKSDLPNNPAGLGYQSVNLENEPGISPNNYAENFKAFLAQRQPGQPFSFWISPWEPHRAYDPGIGRRHGVNPDTLILPPFLPDHPDVRSDVADYLYEIEWMDAQISKSLEYLRETGELDNTLIVYTSDNGMPFPRAKSNNYTYGVRVPLAMRWGHQRAQGLILDDMVSLTDLAPTFLDMAGVPVPDAMTGRSLKGILNKASRSGQFSDGRAHAFTGFERHIGDARAHNRGYPSRAIHTQDWIYIINLAPERSPAGPPKRFADIDDGSPTKEAIIQLPELDYYLQLATAKRPEEELYDLKNDLGQLNNLADSWRHYLTKYQLRSRLLGEMRATADPHTTGHGADFDTYTYYGKSYAKRSNKPTPDDVKDTGTVQSFAGDNIRWNHIILYTIAGIGLIFALFFVFRKKTKS